MPPLAEHRQCPIVVLDNIRPTIHESEVIQLHAMSPDADVVNLQAVRHWTVGVFPDDPVGQRVASTHFRATVAEMVSVPSPE